MRKRSTFLALIMALGLVASACGGGTEEEAGESPAAGAEKDCTASALEAAAADFTRLGEGPKVLPQAGGTKTVKLGFMGDISGSNSSLIISPYQAAKLAVKQANASGDYDVTIELVAKDNKDGKPDTAPALARDLINDEGVVGVVGPGFSGETKVTGDLFAEAGLAHVSPSATNPDLTKNGWKTFFRALATDDVQGGQTGELIVDGLGCKTVAVINDKSEYGAGLAKAVEASIKEAGGEVVVSQGIEPTTDYTSVIDSVIPKNPDVLYYSGYVSEAPLVLKQYKAKGGKGLFMGGDGVKGADFIKEGAKDAEGTVLTCPCLDPNASDDPAAQKFAADYKAEYKTEADIYSAEGWDSTQILLAAIKDGGANVTRESVLKHVTDLKDFKGLTKTFNWTSTHEVEGGDITYVYVVEGGKYKLLGRVDELTA